jgi:hypothetical protein
MQTTSLSPQSIEFITVGLAYCTSLETEIPDNTSTYIATLSKILPLLYVKASLVETNDADMYEEVEKFVTEHDYIFIREKIASIFGSNDNYLDVSDEVDTPIMLSISEDLADVYQDVKDVVMNAKMSSPEVVAMAINECIGNFQHYWGQKLLNALKQIHKLVYSAEIDETMEEPNLHETKITKDTFGSFLRDDEDDYSKLL